MDTPSSFHSIDFRSRNKGQDESQHIIDAYLNQNPFKNLFFWTFVLVLGIISVAVVDISFIYHLISQRTTDILGNSTTSTLWVVVESSVMLLTFLVIGNMINHPGWPRFGAIAIYIVAIVFLSTNIISVYADDIRQIWGSASLTIGSGLGASLNESTDPPVWFIILISAVLAVFYSIPGISFCLLKSWAQAMKEKWEIRFEALAVKGLITDARNLRIRAQTLRASIENARDPKTLADAAKAAVVEGIGAYRDGVRTLLASNVINMTDARGVQQQKKKVIDEANECLSKAQSIDLE